MFHFKFINTHIDKSSKYIEKIICLSVISTLTVSPVIFTGCSKKTTSANANQATSKTAQEEKVLVANLNKAVDVIQTCIKLKQWDIPSLNDLCTRLTAIEARLTLDSSFKKDTNLIAAINNADKVVYSTYFNTTPIKYNDVRDKANAQIEKIKGEMDLKTEREALREKNDNIQPGLLQPGSNAAEANGVIDDRDPISAGTEPSVSTSTKSTSSIQTKYGNHTYSCKTQKEYNAVMAKVNQYVSNLGSVQVNKYYLMYINGAQPEQYPKGSLEYGNLTLAKKNFGYFMYKDGKDNALKYVQGEAISAILSSGETNPGNGSPSSAYDIIVRKVGDCDADAQLQSVIFDSLGYSTMVVGKSNDVSGHAWCLVKVGGTWWQVGGGILPGSPDGLDHISEPTF